MSCVGLAVGFPPAPFVAGGRLVYLGAGQIGIIHIQIFLLYPKADLTAKREIMWVSYVFLY
jgi:hypothetical protein